MRRATITTESTGHLFWSSLYPVANAFSGLSVRRGIGCYKRGVEDSHDIIIINLEGFGDFDRAVMAVAREIKTANKQDSVLVIFDEVDAFLV